MGSETSIPKGTRDFGPVEMTRRNYIFDTIRDVFRLFGYLPIETPAMENLSTLLGKYGEEGDKLLFRILNSGDFLSRIDQSFLPGLPSASLSPMISEKGLRYDLTVPFARYVVQHRSEISFPFRRFQIQPVWRADRPQKGRYREFYQCDADVIGSDSIYNEYELLKVVDEVFTRLGIKSCIKINNRKVLAGIVEVIGEGKRIIDITVAIDKIDKIGIDAVNSELESKGISSEAVKRLQPILFLSGSSKEKLDALESILSTSPTGLLGIEEMKKLYSYIDNDLMSSEIELDLTLARGLNYYTGAIIEVKASDVAIGSICGGGRYDDLTGIFGMPGVSGVGVSFGADRIYDVMSALNLFPEHDTGESRLMLVNFGGEEEKYSITILNLLREKGICAEMYPDQAKMKKQLAYANSRGIEFVCIAGEDERTNGQVTLRNMLTGEQETFTPEQLPGRLA
ncbi:MAG: histidine--tRNA ligase [Bacteroidia bacterium]|nr:MAG: histidine--tRNA ligase [Bacteroidia bacterium]